MALGEPRLTSPQRTADALWAWRSENRGFVGQGQRRAHEIGDAHQGLGLGGERNCDVDLRARQRGERQAKVARCAGFHDAASLIAVFGCLLPELRMQGAVRGHRGHHVRDRPASGHLDAHEIASPPTQGEQDDQEEYKKALHSKIILLGSKSG